MSTIDPQFPLIELHRHLDGNIRLETILDIGLKHNLPLPAKTLEELRLHVQVHEAKASILEFFEKFEWLKSAMVNYESCRRIAYENVEDAKKEGIDYIELRFSPWFMAERHHLEPAGVVEAVVDGIRAGSQAFDMKVNLIGIISRTYGPQIGMRELDALMTQRDAIVALDLAGDEINFPGEAFRDHFQKAREAGWHACPHAGEAVGPQSIWQAIRELGAERIGHAVTAVQDQKLLDYMAEHAIGIESNLTSNVQTSTVRSYREHPLKLFLEQGIQASINTDDPGISAISLEHEYSHAAVKAGLTLAEIHQAQRNAHASAFLSNAEKLALINTKSELKKLEL